MRPKPSKPREVERIVESLGFFFSHQTGSHRVYRHIDGRRVVIPFHSGDMKTGTLRSIITKDLEITVEEFNALR